MVASRASKRWAGEQQETAMLKTILIAGCCWVIATAAAAAVAQPSVDAAIADTPNLDSAGLAALCANGSERKGNWGKAVARQMIKLGWDKIGSNDGPAALKFFAAALEMGPERPDAYWGMGIAGHIAGRDSTAVDACFTKTQALLPEVPGGFADHGRVLESRGKPKLAIEKFRRALSIDPNFV